MLLITWFRTLGHILQFHDFQAFIGEIYKEGV